MSKHSCALSFGHMKRRWKMGGPGRKNGGPLFDVLRLDPYTSTSAAAKSVQCFNIEFLGLVMFCRSC